MGREREVCAPADSLSAPAWSSVSFCLLSERTLGPCTGGLCNRLLDDFRWAAVSGDAVAACDDGPTSRGAAPVSGAPASMSTAEMMVSDRDPPLVCTSPLRGSPVTLEPIDVVAVVLVDPVDAGAMDRVPGTVDRVPIDEILRGRPIVRVDAVPVEG